MTLSNFAIFILPLAFLMHSCQMDSPQLADPPAEEVANFTIEKSAESDNVFTLTNQSDGFIINWDLGNGTVKKGKQVQAIYPFPGNYTIKLTVFTSGGSVSQEKKITIEAIDEKLIDKFWILLSGGVNSATGSKTWIIDFEKDGHFGVGPSPSNAAFKGYAPIYYDAKANDKSACATIFYDDEYTFELKNFKFIHNPKGTVYVKKENKDYFTSTFGGANIMDAPCDDSFSNTFVPSDEITCTISSKDSTLSFSNNGFIGMYTGAQQWKILKLTETELYLAQEDRADSDLMWYHRFIPK